MSTPIVDASNVAAIIAAFKAANAPFPSPSRPAPSRGDNAAPHDPEQPAALVTIGGRSPADNSTAPLLRPTPTPPFPAAAFPIATQRQPTPSAPFPSVANDPAPAVRLLLEAIPARPATPPLATPEQQPSPLSTFPAPAVAPVRPSGFAAVVPLPASQVPAPPLPVTPPIAQPVEPTSAPDAESVRAAARTALDAAYSAFFGGARLAAAVLAKQPPPELLRILDRRALFAIATDVSGLFSKAERKAALEHLGRLAGAALRPTTMAAPSDAERLAGYAAFLDAAGPEEKRSPEWLIERAAARFGQERLTPPEALGEDAPDVRAPVVALLKSAFEAFSGLAPRIADQAMAPLALRDMPFIGGFLTQEMLLAALAIIRQTGAGAPEDEARPGRRRLPANELPGAGESLILPLGPRWSAPGEALARVTGWEARSGLVLPDDYRRFIDAFDGGRVYPNIFVLSVPDEDGSNASRLAVLDRFHAWTDVEAGWTEAAFMGRPPKALAIGRDVGGADILLSLAVEDAGAVHLRPAGEGVAHPLAPSFEVFMASLGDVPGLAGFRRWNCSSFRLSARRLRY